MHSAASRAQKKGFKEGSEILKCKKTRLAHNLHELKRAPEKLLLMKSGIQLRCLPARVSTAKQLPGTEREEVFEIASDETARLSQLMTGFLDYASARQPKVATSPHRKKR
jgi:hypothetical protein